MCMQMPAEGVRPPELESQAGVSGSVWVLGTEPGSSARATQLTPADPSLRPPPVTFSFINFLSNFFFFFGAGDQILSYRFFFFLKPDTVSHACVYDTLETEARGSFVPRNLRLLRTT